MSIQSHRQSSLIFAATKTWLDMHVVAYRHFIVGGHTRHGESSITLTLHERSRRPEIEIARTRLRAFTAAVRTDVAVANWYGALALALSLPDICGHVAWGSSLGNIEKRYVRWFDENLSELYGATPIPEHFKTMLDPEGYTALVALHGPIMTGLECYALRNAFLHAGAEDAKAGKQVAADTKFLLVVPRPFASFHRMRMRGAIGLQVDLFCTEICDAVDRWADVLLPNDADARARVLATLSIRAIGEAFSLAGAVLPLADEFHVVDTY